MSNAGGAQCAVRQTNIQEQLMRMDPLAKRMFEITAKIQERLASVIPVGYCRTPAIEPTNMDPGPIPPPANIVPLASTLREFLNTTEGNIHAMEKLVEIIEL